MTFMLVEAEHFAPIYSFKSILTVQLNSCGFPTLTIGKEELNKIKKQNKIKTLSDTLP